MTIQKEYRPFFKVSTRIKNSTKPAFIQREPVFLSLLTLRTVFHSARQQ